MIGIVHNRAQPIAAGDQTLDVGPGERTTSPDPHGIVADRYIVLEEVGHGAMGRVVRAYDVTLQREVAIKTVAQESETDVERIVTEARSMARVPHPNVVRVFDV
jgi:serine/threonine protein kinase